MFTFKDEFNSVSSSLKVVVILSDFDWLRVRPGWLVVVVVVVVVTMLCHALLPTLLLLTASQHT